MSRGRILKKAFAVVAILALFLSDIPAGVLVDAYRDRNVVDTLYMAYRSGNVVDLFSPDKAYAAEVTVDGTVDTTTNRHQKSGKNVVCTTDQICYAFYNNDDQDVEYQKSTNGGASWGGTSTQISAGTWQGVAAWYDKWTPGNSGTLVHLVYFNATNDDLTYAQFDTSSDTFTADVAIAATGAQGSLTATNDIAVTRSTDGDLYVGTVDTTAPSAPASFVHKCSASCTTAGNWSAAGSNPWDGVGDDTDGDHAIVMLPLSNTASHDEGDIMLVSYDVADGTVEYKVYDDSANSWSTNFTDIDTATDNTTYQHALGGTVNPATGQLYITFVHLPGTANTSEVRTWKYNDGWSQLTDPWPDTTDGASIILDANIGVASSTNALYVAYIRAASTAASNDVYYASSTNDGSSWTTDQLLSSGTDRDHRAVSLNASSDARLYAIWNWNDAVLDQIFANTVADIFTWRMAAYRFFNNADSTDVGSFLAAQDAPATLSATGGAFRLRLLLNNAGRAPLTAENLKLQFAARSGTCDTAYSGESYADVTSGTVIAYNNNSTPADGDNLTANGSDPLRSGHTVVNQDYEEANNFTNTVAVVDDGEDGKWDFALIDNGAPTGTTYCFRVVKSDGSALETPLVVPELTTYSPTIEFSISDASIEFGTLSAIDDFFADDSGGNATEVEAHNIVVRTNAANGYTLTATGTTLTVGSETIEAIGSVNTASTPGTEQFGLRMDHVAGSDGTVSAPYAAAGFAFDTAAFPDTVGTASAVSSTTYSVRYVANISATASPGSYSSVLTYIATANF